MNQLVSVADGGTIVRTSPLLERLRPKVGVRPSVQLVGEFLMVPKRQIPDFSTLNGWNLKPFFLIPSSESMQNGLGVHVKPWESR